MTTTTKPIFKSIVTGIISSAVIFLFSFIALAPLGEAGMFWVICMVPISLIGGGVITGYRTQLKEPINTGMYALSAPALYYSSAFWVPPINNAFENSGRIQATLFCTSLSVAGVYLGRFLAIRKKRKGQPLSRDKKEKAEG